jgi:putative molybdopterin biosynthesis protein
MGAAGNPLALHTLADAARVRFVHRQPGSGTRLLTEHLRALDGLPADLASAPAPRVEHSHLAVAAAVASGAADAGLGIEAAASHYGLEFVPLVDESYFLVCLKDVLDHPAVVRLREVLAGPDWRTLLAGLPGYAPDRPGEVLSLTRALPWWRYRRVPAAVDDRDAGSGGYSDPTQRSAISPERGAPGSK